MVTFKMFVKSRVEMTPTQYLNIYLSEADKEMFENDIKVYNYWDGYYITLQRNGKYGVTIGNRFFELYTLEAAEKYFWEEFGKYECH